MEHDCERGIDRRCVAEPEDFARSRLLFGPRAVRRDHDVYVVRQQRLLVRPLLHVDDANRAVQPVRDDVPGYPVEQLDGIVVPVGELDELVLRRRLRPLVLLLAVVGRGRGRGLGGGLGLSGRSRRLSLWCTGTSAAAGVSSARSAGDGQARYQD